MLDRKQKKKRMIELAKKIVDKTHPNNGFIRTIAKRMVEDDTAQEFILDCEELALYVLQEKQGGEA